MWTQHTSTDLGCANVTSGTQLDKDRVRLEPEVAGPSSDGSSFNLILFFFLVLFVLLRLVLFFSSHRLVSKRKLFTANNKNK